MPPALYLNKMDRICTNDYDNNEYLAKNTLAFLSSRLYGACNVMFNNEQIQWHENEVIIPTQTLYQNNIK